MLNFDFSDTYVKILQPIPNLQKGFYEAILGGEKINIYISKVGDVEKLTVADTIDTISKKSTSTASTQHIVLGFTSPRIEPSINNNLTTEIALLRNEMNSIKNFLDLTRKCFASFDCEEYKESTHLALNPTV
jgi:hypothetical protein